jgi:hypothetical protein
MLLIGEFAVTPNPTCFRLVYIPSLAEAKLAGCSCRVKEAFMTTSRYEWMFWDAAWKLEGWPVG